MTSISENFGSLVFDLPKMEKRLPKAAYRALREWIDNGTKCSMAHADAIAHAIMEWALEKGATHYTHWFQPMTGSTAQKHDAFLSLDRNFQPIEQFSGNQLIQSEPDASSFPSGGMRSTFEARGYTAWDPSSPVFVMRAGDVSVLCIPSVFISYTGHALDKKTPLLRSLKALNAAASQSVKLLTGKDVKILTTLGLEQEYFLVDEDYFNMRPDLIMAGRTLLGCRPAKGQQLEDHYFGAVKDRVLAFMSDFENRLYELGVPAKTRHNEVAPHQFEMAPIFMPANLSADQNQIIMEMLKRVAHEHGLAALLHEKPFAEVNGSGKHCNWSMSTSDSENLLEPGSEPHSNIHFLYFLVAVVDAMHRRGDLVRSAVATAGNDHRLGANEAPPAIMSVFLGSQLSDILNKIESAEEMTEATLASIDLGLSELPNVLKDTTDRNRTSPMAFTGNKFELRACGSNQSVSIAVALLNAAVAESLNEMNEQLEKLETVDEKSVFELLRPFITRSKAVRFEGNNYSSEWHEEAAKRGLSNLPTTPEAYTVWEKKDHRKFVAAMGLMTEHEMDARVSVKLDHYIKQLGIESNLMLRMVDTYVFPACMRYQTEVANSVAALENLGIKSEAVKKQRKQLERLAGTIADLVAARDALEKVVAKVEKIEDEKEAAMAYAKKVFPAMTAVRSFADELEARVDHALWELPTYHELLFLM